MVDKTDTEIIKLSNRSTAIWKVYIIFQVFAWHWANDNKPPTMAEIEKVIIDLEKDAKESKLAETGRLIVEFDKRLNLFNYSLRL